METILFIVLIIIVLISVFFLYPMQQKLTDLQKPKEGDENLFIMIQNQIQEQARSVQDLTKTLDQKIAESTKSMNTSQQHLHTTLQEQFSQNTRLIQGISGQSTKMIGEITEKLTSLDKTNQQVIGFSAQLTNLEKVLTSQKQRGNLGEAGLQLVLENILPPGAFALQYEFEDGDTVDAAVFTKDGIIPVDAKFPLENYNKLVDEVVGRLWKGKEATPYFSLVNSLEYLPGVPEMFTYVESQDYITAIVSASSLDVAKRVQNDYGIDHLFANQLIIKEGKVAGEFVWPIGAGKDKKAEIIRHLCTDLGISAKEVIYIGDSDTDIEAFKEVGLAIAFNSSSDALQKVATHVVDSHNLVDVIPILKMYR